MTPDFYGSPKSSGSSSDSSASSDWSSSSSSSANPFSVLEIHYNWSFLPDLLTGTKFLQDVDHPVGFSYASPTAYMTWYDNSPGEVREIVIVDLAKAWRDGIITTQADLELYGDWDPAWDDDPVALPNPNPGSGVIQIVAYYRGNSYTIEATPGVGTPAATYLVNLLVTAAGAVTLAATP